MSKRTENKAVHEFQDLMREIYFRRDKVRGVHGTLLWMISEVGEFTGAVLERDQKTMADEAADIFAWLCSACNLLGVDLEKASFEKYGEGCPKCCQTPCRCQEK